MKKVSIKRLFDNMQIEMYNALGAKDLAHSPALGDYTERNWINLFRDYLPKRYRVDKAMVVDSSGSISDEIDIVIYDALYTPFLWNKNGVIYIPSESVYACFEVKQDISKKHIEYSALKAESVRRLERSSAKINIAGKVVPPKPHFEILCGLICTRNSWKTRESGIEKSVEYITSLPPLRRLNLSCCLEIGSISFENGQISVSEKETALVSFFYGFVHKLQCVGTVPAIDIPKYLSGIGLL